MEYEETLESNFQVLNVNHQKIKKLQKLQVARNINCTDTTNANLFQETSQLIDESVRKLDDMISEKTNHNESIKLRLLAMKMTFYYERSKLLANMEKFEEAKATLVNSLDSINDFSSKTEVIYLGMRVSNYYAYLLIKSEEYENAKNVLEHGVSLYRHAKKATPVLKFVTSDELFSSTFTTISSLSSNKLERLVTNNLQTLAIVYEKIGLNDKLAACQHEVLERKLEMGDEDPIIWAEKSVDLAKQLLEKNHFKDARHHLAAAEYILHSLKDNIKIIENSKAQSSINDTSSSSSSDLNQVLADIANGWVKYGLQLLNVSKINSVKHFYHQSNQLLEKLWISPLDSQMSKETPLKKTKELDEENIEKFEVERIRLQKTLESIQEVEEEEKNGNASVINDIDGFLEFKSLPMLLDKSLNFPNFENKVSVNLVEDTEQARTLFNFIHNSLKQVRLFYTLENYPMEYINAIMDLSELYKYLAFYEEDIESQYAVHKLRADALETLSAVLKEVRPHWYMVVSVELLRELAEVQLELMGLNLRRIYVAQTSDKNQSTSFVRKVEALSDLHFKLKQFSKGLREDTNNTSGF